MSGTIYLAHALGPEVTAKGVETREQIEKLKDPACDLAQGYILPAPMASTGATSLLVR